MTPRYCSYAVISFALAGLASAQSFNLDLFGNSPTTVPSSSFGAAAAQPGVWNSTACAPCSGQSLPIVDLAGQATGVTFDFVDHYAQSDVCTDPNLTADEAALLKSGRSVFPVAEALYQINGLQAGTYDLFFYASARCGEAPTPITVVLTLAPVMYWAQDQTLSGASSSGAFEFRGNYARLRFSVAAGQAVSMEAVSTGLDPRVFDINGLQLVQVPGPIIPVCFASDEIVPCCSVGAFGRGCPSSFQPLGAMLDGVGTPSVSSDSVVITASDVGSGPVLLFQGIDQLPTPFHYGDGLLCTGSSGSVRIGTKQPVGGSAVFPQQGDPGLALSGMLPAIGGTRVYQAVYRNSAPFCTPSTYNTTNAVLITWSP